MNDRAQTVPEDRNSVFFDFETDAMTTAMDASMKKCSTTTITTAMEKSTKTFATTDRWC